MVRFYSAIAAAALATALAMPAYAAPSAKATFTYAALNKVEEAFAGYVVHDDGVRVDPTEECDPDSYVPADLLTCAIDLEQMVSGGYQVLHSTIKMPKHKELLINVSLECGNFLDTQVKSKGGNRNTSTAEATVRVLVLVDDGNGWKAAVPSGNDERDLDGDGNFEYAGATDGDVFCHRYQYLEAVFQGIFTLDVIGWVGVEDGVSYGDGDGSLAACEAGGDGGQDCIFNSMVATCLSHDPEFGIVADLSCFTEEEVRLITASMTATSFNFMYPNADRSGEHEIAVIAYLDAGAGLGGDNPNGQSRARAMIGLGSMSVQTVRMIKGNIVKSVVIDCSVGECAELE